MLVEVEDCGYKRMEFGRFVLGVFVLFRVVLGNL